MADLEPASTANPPAAQVLGALPIAVAWVDRRMRVLGANAAFAARVGEEPASALAGRPLAALVGDQAAGDVDEYAATGTAVRVAMQLPAPDGGVTSTRVSITPLTPADHGGATAVLTLEPWRRDDRDLADAPCESARFEDIVHHASDGILVTGADGRITLANLAAATLFGYQPFELEGTRVDALIPTSSRAQHTDAIARRWAAGADEPRDRHMVVDALRRDGSTFPAEIVVTMLGTGHEAIAFVRDISERARAEQALRRSERSFRALIEQSPDAIAVSRAGRIVYANPALCTALACTDPAAMAGQPLAELAHPDDRSTLAGHVRAVPDTGAPAPACEVRMQRRDGVEITLELVSLRLELDGAPAIVTLGRDITERQRLARQRADLDRTVAIGTLAATMGHEINNPLAYVSANLAHALELVAELPDGPQRATLTDVLTEARDGAERITDIASALDAASLAAPTERARVDMRRVARLAMTLVAQAVDPRARMEPRLEPVPAVLGDESKLCEAIVNLLINAAQAMDPDSSEDATIRVITTRRGDDAVIEVSDNGRGITADQLPRLFDPFFTTRPIGDGTGLGLTLCQQIVRAHDGTIEVDSQPGRGATFRVVLPGVRERARAEPPPSPAECATARGEPRRGRILAIDDEPHVVRAIARTLRAHEVVAVTSAADALDALAADASFDVIFCDLMMPDMTGMELYELMRERHPGVEERIVFISGGAFAPRAQQFLDRVPNPRIHKPFDLTELRTLAQSLVDRGPC